MRRKLKRAREKKLFLGGKCLAMINRKRFGDVLDLSIYWEEHPESIRRAVRAGRIPVYNSDGHQYIFDMNLIKTLPRPRIGRPRKSKIKEVGIL